MVSDLSDVLFALDSTQQTDQTYISWFLIGTMHSLDVYRRTSTTYCDNCFQWTTQQKAQVHNYILNSLSKFYNSFTFQGHVLTQFLLFTHRISCVLTCNVECHIGITLVFIVCKRYLLHFAR